MYGHTNPTAAEEVWPNVSFQFQKHCLSHDHIMISLDGKLDYLGEKLPPCPPPPIHETLSHYHVSALYVIGVQLISYIMLQE